MTEKTTKAYGEGRVRAGVSYSDVERAAIAIQKSERRPTVETVREALGGVYRNVSKVAVSCGVERSKVGSYALRVTIVGRQR